MEQTAAAAQMDLKDFIAAEGDRTRAELRAEFRAEIAESRAESRSDSAGLRTEIAESRADFRKELRQQMLWFFAMQIAVFSAAFTLAKLVF